MNQNIYINEIPSAELTIYDNGTPVTVVIANGAVLQNKVPYTGATQNVNLGEYGISAGFVQLDTTPTTYTPAVGNIGWNDSEGTIDLLLKGGVVSLPLGQKQVARIVNGTGGNVLKSNYQVVKVTGAQGQRLQVNLAQANNDANSADTLGLIAENINNNNSGFIITSGLVENINTTGSLQSETWTDGNVLYLSPTTAGAITNVKPQAPNHTVIVGFVVYAHANNGKIYVKVDNGYELDELHNVLINTGTLANGQVLKYNSSLQVWENNTDAGGITGTGTSGQVAYWNGTTTQTGSSTFLWNGTTLSIGGTTVFSPKVYINGLLEIADGQGITNGASLTNGEGVRFSSAFGLNLFATGQNVLRIFNTTRNVAIQNGGTFTDSGQRLQVTGDTLLKGSGSTSATNGLIVQDSNSRNVLQAGNDGTILIGNLISSNNRIYFGDSNYVIGRSDAGYRFQSSRFATTALYHFDSGAGLAITSTSGTSRVLYSNISFAPTSGTGILNYQELIPTINQTGGANGVTRGLYVNPTLTAAADWRSIEWSNNTGWGLYGAGTANNYLGGNLQIGFSTALNYINLYCAKNITAASFSYAIAQEGTVQSTVTNSAYGFANYMKFAASVTTANYNHFYAEQSTIGAGTTITNQFGFRAHESMTGATNNYGFYGNIASGTGRWNLYMNGTALNYLNGNLLLGTTTDAGFKLDVNGTARIQNDLTISDTRNIILATTTGTKIGTATSQKLGFWNATPIVQPTTGVASATRVGGAGTTLTDTDTFDGYTLAQIVKALRNTGILA